jgi:hypothetical protein
MIDSASVRNYVVVFFKEMYCTEIICSVYKKESRNRPGVAQRVPGGLGSQIFMTFGT